MSHMEERSAFSGTQVKRARQTRTGEYLRVDPPERIDVNRLGTWWPGRRTAWLKSMGDWCGLCQWREDTGIHHVGLVRQHKMRPAELPPIENPVTEP